MINEHADHPPNHPPPNREIENSPKSFLPILLLILVAYFAFTYRLNTPFVTVTTVKISDYSLSTSSSTASFTFTFHAAVTNPTRGDFSYSSTSSHLFHAGQQVGSLLIPGRRVTPGTENVMEVSMFVKPIPVSVEGYIPATFGIGKMKQAIDLDLQMKIVGTMTVFGFFTSQIERVVECRFTITVFDGSLILYHC